MSEKEEQKKRGADNFDPAKWQAGPKAFAALAVAILFFSGMLVKIPDMQWLSAFDFSTLVGKFGVVKSLGKDTFLGSGGLGARGGFMFALSLIPGVMFAVGCIEVLDHYGAIRAAQRLLTPLLKPLLGLPGLTGLAMMTDLQSTDAGAALTKELYDKKLVDLKELTVMTAWQYSGAGLINNYFMIGSALLAYLTCPLLIPLILMLVFKFVGAIYVRIILNTFYKGDFKSE